MPYKLLHHSLKMKLQHRLIKNQERSFVFSRLRLLDELCFMDGMQQSWRSYFEIGVKHQLWPVSSVPVTIISVQYLFDVIFSRII